MRKLSPKLDALISLPADERAEILAGFSEAEAEDLLFCWEFWARPEQMYRPGPERHVVALAGRFFGKTRMGSEASRFMGANPELCGGHFGNSWLVSEA